MPNYNKIAENIMYLLSISDSGEFDNLNICLPNNSHKILPKNNPKIIKENDLKFNYWKQSNILDENIYQNVQKCKSCNELYKIIDSIQGYILKDMATNTVFATGNNQSKIMIIGEAPGAEEDKSGEPFVGDSGKLMQALFDRASFFRKADIYISNIIPWRPANNRTPTNEEIQTCLPFIIKHISLIKPKIILMLGSIASKALTNNPDIKITSTRGQWFMQDFYKHKVKMLATYHPSFLLRQPRQKKYFWQDILTAKKELQKLINF